ncbi:COP23 domain-containing protein [Gloeothece verrucosa]|uniref:Uncharacterized protein n=1 Tax=Gloeothece verrucosa (strain PCC 7822) TaxID=497965 RepID=E0UCK6_GLOV7|nr:COP23 domain-containing protein [Gloeothece verrucosa]ADN14077.1 hypothetical protein Cyan7822_2097 [Gloeothece verrucosa PCC 7822]
MNFPSSLKFLTCCAVSLMTLTGIIPEIQAQPKPEIRFICGNGLDPQDNQYYPTTYALTERGKIAVVRWKYQWFGDPDVVLQGRCQTVASTFQFAYDQGNLNYITNDQDLNGQPRICGTSRFFGHCVTVLFGLRSSTDSLKVLSQIQQALKGHKVSLPSPRLMDKSQAYISLDMNQFFATAPVEPQ